MATIMRQCDDDRTAKRAGTRVLNSMELGGCCQLEALIYLVTDNKAQKYFNSVINLYFDEILMVNFIRSLLAD